MIYIKLEEDMDKFMIKYQNMPRIIRKILFKSKCRRGIFNIKKIENSDYITIPEINKQALKKLEKLSNIKCIKNICISDNLRVNSEFMSFVDKKHLRVMDGKWLFKNMIDKIVEYIATLKGETLEMQEITILCNKLDDTILEKIREICISVKICNVLSKNPKQFQKLEEELYQTNGIILNVSNHFKKIMSKSSIIINFDFKNQDLEKCIFSKDCYKIYINNNLILNKKELNGKNITSYKIELPIRYLKYETIFSGFNPNTLYESYIYKNTNYKNIKKEIIKDNVKIAYLEDINNNILQKQSVKLLKKA